MTERLRNAVNQIKQFQLCYHCDFYDEDNAECKSDGCICVDEVANQIGLEIYKKALDDAERELLSNGFIVTHHALETWHEIRENLIEKNKE